MIASPGKWVSEEQLIALKGIKKGTLKKAREKSFMEGREYKHVAHDGMPWASYSSGAHPRGTS